MWKNEIIFSKGDFQLGINGSSYRQTVLDDYETLEERFEHVKKMIDRLQYEKEFLEDFLETE